MAPGTCPVGAVDTNNGGQLAIGTSRDYIRLDTSVTEIELTIDAARALILRLTEAINDAEDWAIEHPDDSDE